MGFFFQHRRVSIASRRLMDDSERWRDVGCIKAGQSITDVVLFHGVHHSVITRLYKQFLTSQTFFRRPLACKSYDPFPLPPLPPNDHHIVIVVKWNRRATFTRVITVVPASIGKTISASTVRKRLHMNGL